MSSKSSFALGVVLMAFSTYLFALSIWGQSWKYLLMTSITIVFSLFNGKTLAALSHDSEVLSKRKEKKVSAGIVMTITAIVFIFFVSIMSLATTIFFKLSGYILPYLSPNQITLLCSVTTLIATYAVFKYIYGRKPDELKSLWGKKIEKVPSLQESVEKIEEGVQAEIRDIPGKDVISRISSASSDNHGQP
jgi:hypothetical protein